MSTEPVNKMQNLLWWITSIAISVLCCSVLFVFFASSLVDLKSELRDNNSRLGLIEERQNRILTEIDLIRKHAVQTVAPAPVVPGSVENTPAVTPPADISVVAPATSAAPAVAQPPVASTTTQPTTAPAAAPAIAVPAIAPTGVDKK